MSSEQFGCLQWKHFYPSYSNCKAIPGHELVSAFESICPLKERARFKTGIQTRKNELKQPLNNAAEIESRVQELSKLEEPHGGDSGYCPAAQAAPQTRKNRKGKIVL